MAKKTTLIIGASAAGIACANKLRSLDPEMAITCLTAETEYPYNRCLLADYLGGIKTAEQITIRSNVFFADNAITFRPNTRVIKIDTTEQVVTTYNQETIAYDYLFLGVGKSAFIPDKNWLSIPGVFPFYDQSHATALRAYITSTGAKKAVVVGAGLTGLEAADALITLGLEVTIIEQADQVLPRQIDATGADFLTQLMHKKAGIIVHTKTYITALQALLPLQLTVSLSSGATLETQLVIVATGGKSNSTLAQLAGIACDAQGIITDTHQRTSVPTIFAGGDACSVLNSLTKERVSSCLWADAVQQGNVAAHSIVGIEKEYPGALLITSSTIFGTTLVTSGDISQATHYASRYKKEDSFYHRLFIENDKLKGFIMVGNITGIGQLRKALLEQCPLNMQS